MPLLNRETSLNEFKKVIKDLYEWWNKYTLDNNFKENYSPAEKVKEIVFPVGPAASGTGKTTFALRALTLIDEDFQKQKEETEFARILHTCIEYGLEYHITFLNDPLLESKENDVTSSVSLRVLHNYLLPYFTERYDYSVLFKLFSNKPITLDTVINYIRLKENIETDQKIMVLIHMDETQRVFKFDTEYLQRAIEYIGKVFRTNYRTLVIPFFTGTNACEYIIITK